MIKSRIPYETSVQRIFEQVESLTDSISKKSVQTDKSPLIKVFKDVRLRVLQKKLGEKVFIKFMEHYSAAMEMRVRSKQRDPRGEH